MRRTSVNQKLADAIVQFARDANPLFFLGVQNPLRQLFQLCIGQTTFAHGDHQTGREYKQ